MAGVAAAAVAADAAAAAGCGHFCVFCDDRGGVGGGGIVDGDEGKILDGVCRTKSSSSRSSNSSRHFTAESWKKAPTVVCLRLRLCWHILEKMGPPPELGFFCEPI